MRKSPVDRASLTDTEVNIMNDTNRELWKKCVEFHGHECGGLAIGYQASLLALELLAADPSKDEELVCITENDACGVDAIQALLGCTLGKGNLLIQMRGKQAFSFYNRENGRSCRLVLRPTPGKTREERQNWLIYGDCHEMFDVKSACALPPEKARIFKSYPCAKCGETTSENYLRLDGGEHVCLSCYSPYSRILD